MVAEWCREWAEPVELPTPQQIEEALFASAPIVWSPLADPQDVSMRMIAERIVVPGFTHVYNTAYVQQTYRRGEIGRMNVSWSPRQQRRAPRCFQERWQTRLKLRKCFAAASSSVDASWWHSALESFGSHRRSNLRSSTICIAASTRPVPVSLPKSCAHCSRGESSRCCGGRRISASSRRASTSWSTSTKRPGRAAQDSDAFAHEVCDAMRAGVHRLLVHEVRGARLDDEAASKLCVRSRK